MTSWATAWVEPCLAAAGAALADVDDPWDEWLDTEAAYAALAHLPIPQRAAFRPLPLRPTSCKEVDYFEVASSITSPRLTSRTPDALASACKSLAKPALEIKMISADPTSTRACSSAGIL
jgi:hypothetical protein